MKVNLEKIEKNTAYLNFEVDEEQFESAMEKSYKKNVKRFSIPGFRKGKAPRRIIEMHYGPEVFYEDAAQFVLPEAYEKGVEEYELNPIDQPQFDIQQIEKGKPLMASAEVTVKPEAKIDEYVGLEVEKVVYNVSDDEVDQEIKALQERNARLVTVEDRAAEMGDIAVIDFKGHIDGVPFDGGTGENYPLELGSKMFIEGFEEQVIGMTLGEEKDIKVTFPEDYNAENLAGKDAVFAVKLNELKKKELLPLDDEFAKDVSEFDTLDELKADIKNRLSERAKSIEEGSLKASIINKLADKTEIDIPQVMIERETERLVMDFAINLRLSGYDMGTYLQAAGVSAEDLRAKFRDNALENVKSSLILEAVAKKENITVNDDELEERLKEQADKQQKSVEEHKNNLKPEDIAGIKDALLTQKIFDFLIENSKITEKSPEDIKEKPENEEELTENKV